MCSVVSSGRNRRVIVILVVVAERIGLVVTVVTAVPSAAARPAFVLVPTRVVPAVVPVVAGAVVRVRVVGISEGGVIARVQSSFAAESRRCLVSEEEVMRRPRRHVSALVGSRG
jgi:hypothetical protein